MNAVLEQIKSRRSIRRYRPDPIPQEILDQIIEAGTYAASGKGQQSAIIVQVTDRETRDKIADWNRRTGGWPEGHNHVYDGSLVMGNLMLAAHALGVGSCWINRARQEFDTGEGKALLRSWGVEGDYEGIGHCALGWPDGDAPQAAPRKENWVYYVK